MFLILASNELKNCFASLFALSSGMTCYCSIMLFGLAQFVSCALGAHDNYSGSKDLHMLIGQAHDLVSVRAVAKVVLLKHVACKSIQNVKIYIQRQPLSDGPIRLMMIITP